MKTDIVYTGDMASVLPIHKLESLPEDPAAPGVRLIPARVGIEVLPGLVYFADATIWRSVERCAEGLRWRARPDVESGNVLNAPICVDSRGCTIGVSVVPMYQRRVVTSVHRATEREIQERRLRDLREGVEKGASAGVPVAEVGDSIEDMALRAGLPREMAPADRIAFDRAIRPEHMPPASPEDGAVLAAITRPSVIGDDGSIREIADEDKFPSVCLDRPTPRPPPVSFDPRAMAERASYRRTVGQGFQEGFEEGVRRERARAAIADHAKPRT